jgi:hypothetical protein
MKLFRSKNIKVLLGIFALVVLIVVLQNSGFFSNIEGYISAKSPPPPPKKNTGETVLNKSECKSNAVNTKTFKNSAGWNVTTLTCK